MILLQLCAISLSESCTTHGTIRSTPFREHVRSQCDCTSSPSCSLCRVTGRNMTRRWPGGEPGRQPRKQGLSTTWDTVRDHTRVFLENLWTFGLLDISDACAWTETHRGRCAASKKHATMFSIKMTRTPGSMLFVSCQASPAHPFQRSLPAHPILRTRSPFLQVFYISLLE